MIFGFCVLPEIVLFGADHGIIGNTRWRNLAYLNGGFWIGMMGDWAPNYPAQVYVMFISYGFLHGGVLHLLVNMMALFSLANSAVQKVGQSGFAVLYFLSLVGGAAGFAALSDNFQPMIGASGALFGLLGALMAWELGDRRRAQLAKLPIIRAIVLLAGLNLVLWWAMNGRLAWETHLGGFLTGWVIACLLAPRARG